MTGASYRATIITPDASMDGVACYEDGLLVVDDEGRIAHVGSFDAERVHGTLTTFRARVLMPGLCDVHLHYPQTRIIGSASGPLLDWLERSVFPEEAKFAEEQYARTVADELVQQLLRVGTTCVGLFSSSDPAATDVVLSALSEAGLRGWVGLTLMDQRCPSSLAVPCDRAMGACRELASRWHGHDGRLEVAITPRFALSCSRPLMEAAAELAAELELPIQTHVSENAEEGVQTLAEHPFASDYLDVYDQMGLLTERTLLAHAIHLSESEWDRVAARGARIAHCPDSNFFLGSGRMHWDAARRREVRMGLGSDVAAGRTFDMRRIAASAYDNALCLGASATPAELLRAATLGGAEALGVDRRTGSLEVGKDADFIVVEVPDYADAPEVLLGHLVFASELTPVEAVYTRGVRRTSS